MNGANVVLFLLICVGLQHNTGVAHPYNPTVLSTLTDKHKERTLATCRSNYDDRVSA